MKILSFHLLCKSLGVEGSENTNFSMVLEGFRRWREVKILSFHLFCKVLGVEGHESSDGSLVL